MKLANRFRISGTAAGVLMAAVPALTQQSVSSWKLVNERPGVAEISAQAKIAEPEGAGLATLKIICQPTVDPPLIVKLVIESPKSLPKFPFDNYDGPVEMTRNEFMTFGTGPGDPRTIKVMPSGYYGVDPPGAFLFETIEKRMASFLLQLEDGQKLSIMVNGPPSSIQIAFDTTGLKDLLGKVVLRPAKDEWKPSRRHCGQRLQSALDQPHFR